MNILARKKSSIYEFNRGIIESRVYDTAGFKSYIFYFLAIALMGVLVLFPSFVNSQSVTSNNNEIIELTNIEREKYGLTPLVFNDELYELARARTEDMEKYNYFAHMNPYGKKFSHFLQETDYNFIIAGENLGINFYSNEKLMKAWMDSPSHKKNIINSTFSDIAIFYSNIEINDRVRPVAVMILGKEMGE